MLILLRPWAGVHAEEEEEVHWRSAFEDWQKLRGGVAQRSATAADGTSTAPQPPQTPTPPLPAPQLKAVPV